MPSHPPTLSPLTRNSSDIPPFSLIKRHEIDTPIDIIVMHVLNATKRQLLIGASNVATMALPTFQDFTRPNMHRLYQRIVKGEKLASLQESPETPTAGCPRRSHAWPSA
jgi:hypothetical protein